MQVELVSPERILYSGEADTVIARTIGGGELAFLTGHAPFVGALEIATVTITVIPPNQAPDLNDVPSAVTIREEEEYTFTATASDDNLPSGELFFALEGAPDGAFIDEAAGAFTWTPTEEQGPGEYAFLVRVSDGALAVRTWLASW